MSDAERVEITKAPKEFAKQNPSKKRQHRQQRTWNMRDCEQGSCGQNRAPRAKQGLHAYKENSLQDELLRQRPNYVLPRPAQRERVAGTCESKRNAHQRDYATQDHSRQQDVTNSCEWSREAQFASRPSTRNGKRDHACRHRNADESVYFALWRPDRNQNESEDNCNLDGVVNVVRGRRRPNVTMLCLQLAAITARKNFRLLGQRGI